MSSRELIYPDTIIWNLLCDQDVDPSKMIQSLSGRGFTFAISFHTIYELARNFERGDPPGIHRGRQLFAYLKRYLDHGTPCTKELWEMIIAVAYAMENHLPSIDPMATANQCTIAKDEVEKLAQGTVEGRVKDFLEQRRRFAQDTKAQQEAHFIDRPELKAYLAAIPQDRVAEWMSRETFTAAGANLVYQTFIKNLGRGASLEYIMDLLQFPLADATRATVRADLYSNWKCARDGTNRLDLIDDVLHVLQAVHCGLYLTEDKNQLQYSFLLLTPRTRVEIYPTRSTPIADWIVNVIQTNSSKL